MSELTIIYHLLGELSIGNSEENVQVSDLLREFKELPTKVNKVVALIDVWRKAQSLGTSLKILL